MAFGFGQPAKRTAAVAATRPALSARMALRLLFPLRFAPNRATPRARCYCTHPACGSIILCAESFGKRVSYALNEFLSVNFHRARGEHRAALRCARFGGFARRKRPAGHRSG